MHKVNFLNKNNKRWAEAEDILKNKKTADTEKVVNIFIELTDDLAYAQTYYPDSDVCHYLNKLTLTFHNKLFKSKRFSLKQILEYFTKTYPLHVLKHYDKVIISLIIFLLSVLIGAVSAANDDQFVRLILGDGYVDKTLENIKQGNPLGVYSDSSSISMFFLITLNNIKVAMYAFGLGAIFSIGTGLLLFSNGIMLGSFQYFFYSKGLLLTSVMGIWMHGTIEIFSIVIAGAAGITMGNGLLFPKTYPRKISFQRSAMEGIKILIGLFPLFIIAGFIESFLTRHSNISLLSYLIIGFSIIFILFYFFIYPLFLKNKKT